LRSGKAELSRVRGWHDPRLVASKLQRLSPRLRAPRALPQPDWLGHLLSWIRDLTSRSGWFDRSNPPSVSSAFTAPAPPARAFASCREGPPPAPSREGECVPLHPRCLPSPNSPQGGGLLLHSLSPGCGVGGLAPLQSLRFPFHRRKMRRVRKDSTACRRASSRARPTPLDASCDEQETPERAAAAPSAISAFRSIRGRKLENETNFTPTRSRSKG
jgi:hypothetical protein